MQTHLNLGLVSDNYNYISQLVSMSIFKFEMYDNILRLFFQSNQPIN